MQEYKFLPEYPAVILTPDKLYGNIEQSPLPISSKHDITELIFEIDTREKFLNLIRKTRGIHYSSSKSPFPKLISIISILDDDELIECCLSFIGEYLYLNPGEYSIDAESLIYILACSMASNSTIKLAFGIVLNYSFKIPDLEDFESRIYDILSILSDGVTEYPDDEMKEMFMQIILNSSEMLDTDLLAKALLNIGFDEIKVYTEVFIKFIYLTITKIGLLNEIYDKIFKTFSYCTRENLARCLEFWLMFCDADGFIDVIAKHNVIPKYFLIIYDCVVGFDDSLPNAGFLSLCNMTFSLLRSVDVKKYCHNNFIKYVNECVITDKFAFKETAILLFHQIITKLNIISIIGLMTASSVNAIIHFFKDLDEDEIYSAKMHAFSHVYMLIIKSLYKITTDENCCLNRHGKTESSIIEYLKFITLDETSMSLNIFSDEDKEEADMYIPALVEFVSSHECLNRNGAIDESDDGALDEEEQIAIKKYMEESDEMLANL